MFWTYRNSTVSQAVVVIVAAVGLLALAGSLQAGMISIKDIPATGSDAGSGISTSNTYTHTLDLGTGSGILSINEVAFTRVSDFSGTVNGFGYSYTVAGSAQKNAGGERSPAATDGNMATMLSDFFNPYSLNGNETETLTLSGLTAGTAYSMRVYYRPTTWDAINPGLGTGRVNTVTFNGDDANASIKVYEDDGYAAHYLQYDFNATGTSVTFTSTEVDTNVNNGFHIYGVTNQVMIPEPNILVLLISGLIGLMAYAWRKRR